MTAWATLTANSTLETGTAWEHLQNQQGGGAGTGIVVNDGIACEIVDMTIDVEIDDVIAVEIAEPIEVVIDDTTIEVEIV